MPLILGRGIVAEQHGRLACLRWFEVDGPSNNSNNSNYNSDTSY